MRLHMKTILVLQFKRMGDLVQTMPLLRRLREENPDSHISLACLEEFKGILAGWDGFDRLIPIRVLDLMALSEHLPSPDLPLPSALAGIQAFHESYALLVNLSTHPGSAVLGDCIKADRKLGCIRSGNGTIRRAGAWSKYAQAMISHRTENLFNMVDMQMGMAGLAPKAMAPSLRVPDAALEEARELLKGPGFQGGKKLVAVQAGASSPNKTWPLERFVDLILRLIGDGDVEILLLGDGKERELADRLQEAGGFRMIDLVGMTKVSQLPALCECCDLVVGNDTGTLHIAAAVGTPTLGLFFSTAYFAETGPYGEGHALLQVEIPCAPCHPAAVCPAQTCKQYIDAASVYAAIRWLLETNHGCAPAPNPQVSLYRSRFLSNGLLAYLPVKGGFVSGHFLAGLLGRLLWESAFGMASDPGLESLWKDSQGYFGRKSKCLDASEVPGTLLASIRRGLEWVGQLRAELAKPFPDSSRTGILQGRLADHANELTALGVKSGLWGKYLLFEMLDMDYQAYPDMACVLERKYQGLDQALTRVLETLERLSAE